jgi:hypothetical protein
MKATNKKLRVKQWMGNKIANEIGRSITMCDIFGILKETEKAIYAVIAIGCDQRKTMWIPKSAIEEQENGMDTYEFDSYEEAVEALKNEWALYR